MNNKIILSTANARYSHSSFGLRYLYANLGEYQHNCLIVEHIIKDSAQSIADNLLSFEPKIIGLGIYIWNIELLTDVVKIIRSKSPKTFIIIGGPEVSYGVEDELYELVDYIIELEGEVLFKNICEKILNKEYVEQKVFRSAELDLKKIQMPYQYYSDDDVRNRKIYVEVSRGCAFKCQFCLSSLDNNVRHFDLDLFLEEIERLYQRGARQFKFVDRTFNLQINLSAKILSFFLEKFSIGDYFLHFELIPDRLPLRLKEFITKFPAGSLQFEIGIQTFDSAVSDLIGRRQNKIEAIKNLSFLRTHTNTHLHVDLIIGLPGATVEIFKQDLNQLVEIGLQEVQIGMLKLLKGTPIKQHISTHQLKFSEQAPYEIISTKDIDVQNMEKLKIFQKFWEKYYNSGNFIRTMKFLFAFSNPFDEFYKLSHYSFNILRRTHSIGLDILAKVLFDYLGNEKDVEQEKAKEMLVEDLMNKKGRKVPPFLKGGKLKTRPLLNEVVHASRLRQANHLSQY